MEQAGKHLKKEQNGSSKTCSSYDLFIFAGESSGDLHGAALIQALLKQNPHLKIAAVAGPKMRQYPVDVVMEMEAFQVMGFLGVLTSLHKLIPQFYEIKKWILRNNPAGVLLIDYPGFNLKLAKHLKKANYNGKVIQYVCPTVWAWKKSRAQVMEEVLDLLIPLFPFEVECFAKDKLQVKYLGHPLVESIVQAQSAQIEKKYITICPGSRKKEVLQNLPLQLRVARELQKQYPYEIVIVSANTKMEKQIRQLGANERMVDAKERYKVFQESVLAIATSGTVNLELALLEVPTVVNYAINPIDQFLATKVFRINLEFYCIVNILKNALIYPELYGSNLTYEALYRHSLEIVSNPNRRKSIAQDCKAVKELLYKTHTLVNSAKAITSEIFP